MEHLTDAPVANILILAGIVFLAVGLFGRVGGFIGSIFGNIEAGKNSRVLAGVLGLLLILGGGWLHDGSHKSAGSNPSPATPAPSTSPASSTSPVGTASSPVAANVPREVPKANAPAAQPSPLKTRPSAPPEAATPATPRDNSATSSPQPIGDDRLVGTWTNLTPQADTIKRLEVVRVGQALDAHIWHSCSSGECDLGIHRVGVSGSTATYDFTAGDRRRIGFLNLHAPGVLLLTVDILEPGTQHRWHHNWVLVKSTLSEKTQSGFARYLNAPSQKAFAMAPGGAWSYHFKATSAAAAAQTALQHCEERGMPGCRIILLNNDATE
jgi:hypothetical protein